MLCHYFKVEREAMNESARDAAMAIEMIVTQGPDAAMNKYNARKRPPQED